MKFENPRIANINVCLDIAVDVGCDSLWLNSMGKDFEFGDDPDCVRKQIDLARELLGELKPIIEVFDLNTISLGEANRYYSLNQELSDFLKWVEGIEIESWGSSKNARELKKRLDAIVEANTKVWELLRN